VIPEKIHAYWELVRNDLNECRTQDTDEVWLEDIYSCIRGGTAHLYVGLENNTYCGMVLLSAKTDNFASKQNLHIWYCNNSAGHDILREGLSQLETIARQMGSEKITYRANRLSFERLTRDLGFKLTDCEFTKVL
jgi:hypothetical protein